MKKLALALSTTATYLSLAPLAFAQEVVTVCPPGGSPFEGACTFSFANVIGPIITTIFIIATVVALLYLLWGGFKWITSGGDKGAVQAAREHIVAAIVGLVIIFLAYFIINIVLSFFFGVKIGDPNALVLPHIGN